MGAGASEHNEGLCATACLAEKCPAIASVSELQRRQQYIASRKRQSVSYLIKERSTGLSSEQTEDAAAEVDFTTGRLTQVGMQRLDKQRLTQINARAAETRRLTVAEANQRKSRVSVVAHLQDDRKPLDKRAQANEALAHGCTLGDLQRVQRALHAGAKLDSPNARGVTPLMLAVSSSSKNIAPVLEELLKRRANLHDKDGIGWQALHHACRNGKTNVVRLLLAASMDLSATTADKKTGLILAVMEGKYDLVCELLKVKDQKQLVTERDDKGFTALHFAVKEGYLDICKQLLEKKARENAKDTDGRAPLSIACEFGRFDCVKLLCRKQAEVDGQDKSRRSPMMYSCLNLHEAIALWLLQKKGADPHMEDSVKDTPLGVADEYGLAKFKNAVKQRRVEEEDANEEEQERRSLYN